jgi:hypothetical protein
VDSIHAHNALQTPDAANYYSYHTVYGYRRAFDYLRSRGAQVDEIRSGRLDEKSLANCRMLFINLVSADLPPFYVSEIAAIKSYLKAGGSLLLITDHTNCYYHSYKLAPLLAELGINVTTETAADRAPATLGPGNGWIAITRFANHPVTRGLRAIAFETGGTLDDRYAIAMTSPRSWGDQWQYQPYGETNADKAGAAPGFYGNWEQDAGERSGALAVVTAKAVGKGRLVIVADQNIFGDPFINYADNYRLWLNAVAWLTGESQLAQSDAYVNWHTHRVLAYEEYSHAAFGDSSTDGYYNLFVALGRPLWLFASDDLSGKANCILFAHDDYQLSESALANAVRHLRAGRNIVVLGNEVSREQGHRSLLEQFAQKLGASTPAQNYVYGQGVLTYTWPGCGKILVASPNDIFQNSSCAAPEKQPDLEQQRVLKMLLQLITAATPENFG